MTNDDQVLTLLQRLEAENRRLKRLGAGLLLVLTASVLGAAAHLQDPKKKEADSALHDVLRTRRLEIANASGKVVAVLQANEVEDEPGWLTDYHDNGRRKWRAEIEDNRYGGKYTSWWPNGLMQEEGTYTKGRRHGLFTFYHDNGQPKERGAFSDGARSGIWTTWHQNGRKQSEGLYEDDRKIGDWREWHDNEQLSEEAKFVDGKMHGVVTVYFPNGERRQQWHFENGVRVGSYKAWYEDGQLLEEGTYDERGKKTGAWRRYHEDGSVDEKRSRTYGEAGGR